jgi:hypothetical protein
MAIDLHKIFVVYWRVAESQALIPEPVGLLACLFSTVFY